MTDIAEIDQNIQENIDKYGLTVRHVMPGKLSCGFSYSIGLFKTYEHPEIIMIGLKQQLAHVLINNMAYDIQGGKIYLPNNYEANILDNFNCFIIEVDESYYDPYLGGAQRYYGNDHFPVLQCIYPTVKGVFPWEKDWPENIKDLQPILGEVKIG